jgi:hypothetical protein
VESDDVTPVGRSGATPVAVVLPLRDLEVVVVVEVAGITLVDVGVEMELDVDVDTVTTVVRCVDEETMDTVNICVIVVVITVEVATPGKISIWSSHSFRRTYTQLQHTRNWECNNRRPAHQRTPY